MQVPSCVIAIVSSKWCQQGLCQSCGSEKPAGWFWSELLRPFLLTAICILPCICTTMRLTSTQRTEGHIPHYRSKDNKRKKYKENCTKAAHSKTKDWEPSRLLLSFSICLVSVQVTNRVAISWRNLKQVFTIRGRSGTGKVFSQDNLVHVISKWLPNSMILVFHIWISEKYSAAMYYVISCFKIY